MHFHTFLAVTFVGFFALLAGCGGGGRTKEFAMGVVGRAATPTGTSTNADYNAGVSDQLTVLTFNMEHRNNPKELTIMAERLASELTETPDFILCQEVLFNRHRSHGRDEKNTAEILAHDLDYHVRATKRRSDPEGVAIISRYPFQYYAERELESQTSAFLLGFKRVSVMGEFMVPRVGRVRVVNVHFTNWGFEQRVRTNQLQETLEWMAERQAAVHADVVILGGDFNADPKDKEMKLLTEGALASQFNFRNFNTTEPTRGGPGNPTKRIDYIFISSPDRVVRTAGKGEQRLWKDGMRGAKGHSKIYLSDHVPVLHEYAFGGRVIASATRNSEVRAAAN